MKASEIRKAFLEFFKSKDHQVVESSSLVPSHDPTLLFTNAGMNQFKDAFLGKEQLPYNRAASCQKCVRAGGKHNDLENVGFTARHHTFFEMLGNFSFGDYFKEDAIAYAWEFVTKHLKLDTSRVYITVFEDDDEAFDIWQKQIGIPVERIKRLGEKDNFWSMGDVGPCGPCSEIFYDRGEAYSCGAKNCGIGECDCDRFMEFWNLVFMQFDRDESGNLTPLPKPSVDTGMGLERIASILQQTDSNYEIDIFSDILSKTASMAGKTYKAGSQESFNYRVVADHARASTFMVGDGILPSNEGRGYVLRRIIRRAVRYGRNIGFNEPFLYKVCGFVIDLMVDAYPDLKDRRAFIEKAVRAEEEQFFRTLERGLSLLDDELLNLGKGDTLAGEIAFKLYDTFGFPIDLTRIICGERGVIVDEKGFAESMQEQKQQSRQNWKGSGDGQIDAIYHEIAERLETEGKQTEFVGYNDLSAEGHCLAIVKIKGNEHALVDFASLSELGKNDVIEACFAKTPFYGESGGQVGDRGLVRGLSGDDFSAKVIDVQKPVQDLIVVRLRIESGKLVVGQRYLQQTDRMLRNLTARNHTATHLLHWALRAHLGDHVKQAGSLVTPDFLRFDFSHFEALTGDDVRILEEMINRKIWEDSQVGKQEMSKDEAVDAGAIAFFGEKYGAVVRVVSVGDYSVELCGGTHVDRTSEINLFKIISESSIAAGSRRIVAYTSQKAFEYLSSVDRDLKLVKEKTKSSTIDDITGKLDKMAVTEKELRRELEKLRAQSLGSEIDSLIANASLIKNHPLIYFQCPEDSSGIKTLRELADRIKQKAPNAIMVLTMAQTEQGKALLLVAKGPEASKQFKSGDLIKKLSPAIDGRGGGKPEMAQAGGTNLEGLTKMSEGLAVLLAEMI